jgi:hypothetical protein
VLLGVEARFGVSEEAVDATETMERPVSAHQIVGNAKSIIGQSGQQTEATKQWRLRWWEIIIDDTIHGPNFWTGRGFGINLAQADGFGESPSNPRPVLGIWFWCLFGFGVASVMIYRVQPDREP